MADPFAMALGALFSAAGSVAADYVEGDADPLPIRIIRRQPDELSPIGRGRIVQRTDIVEIRRSAIAAPVSGAVIAIRDAGGDLTGEQLTLAGDPRLDEEGMTWTCPANLVR
jgi:hypothetical protein